MTATAPCRTVVLMIATEKKTFLTGPFNLRYADETIPVFARWFGSWRVSVQRLAFSAPELMRLYDRAAPRWDHTLDRLGYPDAYGTLLRRVLSEEGLNVVAARPRILDCGVGTGALSIALARVLRTPFTLDALDLSPRMLEHARRRFRETNLKVTLHQGDVRELPFPDEVFDFAMTAHVLEHLPDPRVALNEMVRVLKPGGLLIACLTSRSALGMLAQVTWRTHRATSAQARRWLGDSGLDDAYCLSPDDYVVRRRHSVACVGRKPDTASSCEPLTRESDSDD